MSQKILIGFVIVLALISVGGYALWRETVTPQAMTYPTTGIDLLASSTPVVATSTQAVLAATSTSATFSAVKSITEVSWADALRFLDECAVRDVVKVNPASSHVDFWLRDDSQYVVNEKISLKEAQVATEKASDKCGRHIYAALPRFMSWSETSYYLNRCEVNFMESYGGNAKQKVYLKDGSIFTIDGGAAVSFDGMKRAADTASKLCGRAIEVNSDTQALTATTWADALLLFDKCVVSSVSIRRNPSHGVWVRIFLSGTYLPLPLSEGVDEETVKVTVDNVSQTCGYSIKIYEMSGDL